MAVERRRSRILLENADLGGESIEVEAIADPRERSTERLGYARLDRRVIQDIGNAPGLRILGPDRRGELLQCDRLFDRVEFAADDVLGRAPRGDLRVVGSQLTHRGEVRGIGHNTQRPCGGVLIRDGDGNVAGAVGISGDTSDNDEACAVAGIEAAGLTPQI